MFSVRPLPLKNALQFGTTGRKCHFVFLNIVVLLQMGLLLTEGSITTYIPNIESEICTCPCRLSTLKVTENAPKTLDEATNTAEELSNDLVLDKSETSSANRAKISVPDERPSAKSVGSIGIVTLLITIATLVLLDLGTFRKDLKSISKKIKTKRRIKKHNSEEREHSKAPKSVHNSEESPSVSPVLGNYRSAHDSDHYSNYYHCITDSNSSLFMGVAPQLPMDVSSENHLNDALKKEGKYRSGSGHELLAIRALMPQYNVKHLQESEA